MPRRITITVPEVTIRTTSNSEGHPHGIATGKGPSPELALSALRQAAHDQAEEAAWRYGSRLFPRIARPDHDSGEWRFEVVDVRLVPALMEGGESGWLAYGTLLSEGEQPRVVGHRPTPPQK
jgi:hypothetical protein